MTIFVTLIDRMGQFVDDIVDYANKSFNPQMVIDGEHGRFSGPLKILDTLTYQSPNAV